MKHLLERIPLESEKLVRTSSLVSIADHILKLSGTRPSTKAYKVLTVCAQHKLMDQAKLIFVVRTTDWHTSYPLFYLNQNLFACMVRGWNTTFVEHNTRSWACASIKKGDTVLPSNGLYEQPTRYVSSFFHSYVPFAKMLSVGSVVAGGQQAGG